MQPAGRRRGIRKKRSPEAHALRGREQLDERRGRLAFGMPVQTRGELITVHFIGLILLSGTCRS